MQIIETRGARLVDRDVDRSLSATAEVQMVDFV
jgi:hypothetical protein